ncbi:AAA family ATPase [Halomonas eurihalina]|uniref:AAA family ATPase n=1 Tax=Halomonas eurihalina TaxID=42566 RepID=A0A5D9DEI0_HALER|nr:AAA family ATPase [Halomonas eurihalina]MDR5857979.1 AAA family ATPase [Halomonas eurihalina]TZG41510.1 AAA family ATPase [Halomonas eurihalina]
MRTIDKVKLLNYKRFSSFEVSFSPDINLLIGDNEAGKSSILTAMELVVGGSKNKVELLGLESLFSTSVITEFLAGEKRVEDLPCLHIELHLNEQGNPDLFGRNNLDGVQANGLQLICEPSEELTSEIKQVLEKESGNFPFEYYSIRFLTFSGEAYTGYRKFLRYLALDSSQINSEYATKEYIKTVYESIVEHPVRVNLQNEYRQQKINFKDNNLAVVNDALDDYQFAVRSGYKSNLETDLTITEDDVPIEHRGKGRQCFIKTEFALRRYREEQRLDILLLEEPENHLSHTNMKRLIQRISESQAKQLFIATHSSLISTRLDLRNSVLLNSSSPEAVLLNDLPEDTSRFFMKAPDNNVLEFVLSSKVILVEGDAEYILIDAIYSNVTGSTLEADDVHVISVGGTSFKRYLDLAKFLNIRTAVVRDNDGDHQANCIESYEEYEGDNIQVFFDKDDANSTFEICLYALNQVICDELFSPGRRKLTPLGYMLKNKADCAFRLRDEKADQLISPEYIRQALAWINE